MAILFISIAALAISLAIGGMFLYALFRKSRAAVHSYWPCYHCGRPVAIHKKEDAQGHMECALCKARNR